MIKGKKQELTEKLGIKYFKRLNKRKISDRIDEQTYLLDAKERENIFRIGKQTVVNAFIIGIVSSAITTFILFWYGKELYKLSDYFLRENIKLVTMIIAASVITSLFEMIFLFFDTLNKTHKITKAAHFELFPQKDKESFIARSIARAALELPNPQKSEININPRKEAIKTKIVIAGIAYKMKVSLTNVLFKILLKKMLGKAISRAYLSVISIPVVAIWNSYEAWRVVKEIKIRVLGPSAIAEMSSEFQHIYSKLSREAKLQVLRAISSAIMATEDLHPNLEYLYINMKKKVRISIEDEVVDSTELFLERIKDLTKLEQRFILYVLEFSAIIDGRLKHKEKELLKAAFNIAGFEYNLQKTERALLRFKKGQLVNLSFVYDEGK